LELDLQTKGKKNLQAVLNALALNRWHPQWKGLVIEAREIATCSSRGRLSPYQSFVLDAARELPTPLDMAMDQPSNTPRGMRWDQGRPLPEDLAAWRIYHAVVNAERDSGRCPEIRTAFVNAVTMASYWADGRDNPCPNILPEGPQAFPEDQPVSGATMAHHLWRCGVTTPYAIHVLGPFVTRNDGPPADVLQAAEQCQDEVRAAQEASAERKQALRDHTGYPFRLIEPAPQTRAKPTMAPAATTSHMAIGPYPSTSRPLN
jgi:hypothetical protein